MLVAQPGIVRQGELPFLDRLTNPITDSVMPLLVP